MNKLELVSRISHQATLLVDTAMTATDRSDTNVNARVPSRWFDIPFGFEPEAAVNRCIETSEGW